MGKYVLHYKDEAVYEIEADSKDEAIAIGDNYWAERITPVEIKEVSSSRSRLDKISAYKENSEFIKAAAEQKVKDEVYILVEQIKALKPRIDELLETGNACLKNGIELDTYHSNGWFDRSKDCYEKGTFVTNGISHHVGFVKTKSGFSELGINNGGACGPYDFRTDGEKVYFVHENNNNDIKEASQRIRDLREFIDTFDEFESEFYHYVDKTLEKQQQSVDNLIDDAKQSCEEVNKDVVKKNDFEFEKE